MELKSIIDAELKKKGKTFKWLVGEIGISNDGLKAGLENESIKFKDLKKMLQVLNMPIQSLLVGDNTIQNQLGGKQNIQASHSSVNADTEYRKMEIEGLRKQITLLESQLSDKDHIIELLRNK